MIKNFGLNVIEKNPYITSSITPPTYPHSHDFFEISFCVKSESTNTINNKRIKFSKGTCVILRPGDVHYLSDYTPLSYEHIDIYSTKEDFKNLCDLCNKSLYDMIINETAPISFLLPNNIFSFLYNYSLILKEMFANKNPLLTVIHSNMITTILSEYIKNKEYSEKYIPVWLNGLLPKFNQIDFISKNISLIAHDEGFSLPYFSKQFKKYIGISAHQYLTKKRIDIAKELLITNPNLSIINIAGMLGFENPSTFSKHFMLLNHVTPREYRQQSENFMIIKNKK